jgi:hypothetical protein
MDLSMKYKSVMTEAEKAALEKNRSEWAEMCETNAKKEEEKE